MERIHGRPKRGLGRWHRGNDIGWGGLPVECVAIFGLVAFEAVVAYSWIGDGRVALFRRQGGSWWLLRHCHRRLRRDRTLSSNSFSSSQIVYNLAPLSCQDPEYCYLFWRLGHGQVDREQSVHLILASRFQKSRLQTLQQMSPSIKAK